MHRRNLMIYADSEHDANMLYAVGVFVADPFVFLALGAKRLLLLSDLELTRLRRQAKDCRVLSLSRYERRLHRDGQKVVTLAKIVRCVFREHKVKKVIVPSNFPHGLARQLRRLGLKLRPADDPFFPERELKTEAEVRKISAALMMAEVGLAEAIQALKNAKIGKGSRLLYHNVPLTSEKLRAIIDIAVMQAGGIANHTIVAGGRQSCEPHESGHGPLKANEPIVLDIFPRSQKTGYYADIARTVVRGRASEAVRRLYATVATAQATALAKLRPAKPCAAVHAAVHAVFDKAGYRTRRNNGRPAGFFHPTGHGLGLQVHEAPRISAESTDRVRAGQVVTIEPGLYYPELGGVRLEDVALVTKGPPRNLTRFEKVLEL